MGLGKHILIYLISLWRAGDLSRKGLLRILGSPSLGVQGQRPILKPSQQDLRHVLCHPLNDPHSLPQPSLSTDLKRA